jgi:hypothetical protein
MYPFLAFHDLPFLRVSPYDKAGNLLLSQSHWRVSMVQEWRPDGSMLLTRFHEKRRCQRKYSVEDPIKPMFAGLPK